MYTDHGVSSLFSKCKWVITGYLGRKNVEVFFVSLNHRLVHIDGLKMIMHIFFVLFFTIYRIPLIRHKITLSVILTIDSSTN